MDDASWTVIAWLYLQQVVEWADGLTKTDLMILLGSYLLGHYMGSKDNARSKTAGV